MKKASKKSAEDEIKKRLKEMEEEEKYKESCLNKTREDMFTADTKDAKLERVLNKKREWRRGRKKKMAMIVYGRMDSGVAREYADKYKRGESFNIASGIEFYEESVTRGISKEKARGLMRVKVNEHRCLDLFNPKVVNGLIKYYERMKKEEREKYNVKKRNEVQLAIAYCMLHKDKYSSVRGLERYNCKDNSGVVGMERKAIVYYILDSRGIEKLDIEILK